MMLLVEGDGAGFGFPSCATRFSPLRFDLCVLSVWHLGFPERHRTTKGREEGGTGRGYHVCAITKQTRSRQSWRRGEIRHKAEAADTVPLLARTGNKDKRGEASEAETQPRYSSDSMCHWHRIEGE